MSRSATASAVTLVLVVLFFISGVLGGLSVGVGGAQSTPTVSIPDAQINVSESVELKLTLNRAPNGLSGFDLNVTVAQAGVANITGGSYPEQYSLTEGPVVSDDRNTAQFKAIDLQNSTKPGATEIHLATVTLNGTADGETELRISVTQMDDDQGNRIDPATQEGVVSVGTGGGSSTSPTTTTETETATRTETQTETETTAGGQETSTEETEATATRTGTATAAETATTGSSQTRTETDGSGQSTTEGERSPTGSQRQTDTTPTGTQTTATIIPTEATTRGADPSTESTTSTGGQPGLGVVSIVVALTVLILVRRRL